MNLLDSYVNTIWALVKQVASGSRGEDQVAIVSTTMMARFVSVSSPTFREFPPTFSNLYPRRFEVNSLSTVSSVIVMSFEVRCFSIRSLIGDSRLFRSSVRRLTRKMVKILRRRFLLLLPPLRRPLVKCLLTVRHTTGTLESVVLGC